jgi:hypothetical protein
MNIEGKLVKVFDLESGTSKAGKEWKKQSILIEQDTKYNPEVVVCFFNDNVNKIKANQIGNIVSCNINLSSREYNGKYYHNIDGYTCNVSDIINDNKRILSSYVNNDNKQSFSDIAIENDDQPF